MLNCKPGDLAVVVSSRNSPENIGRIVEVIRPAVNGERISGFNITLIDGVPAWIVRSVGSKLHWLGISAFGVERVQMVEIRPYADKCLRPIRKPGDHEADTISAVKKEGQPA